MDKLTTTSIMGLPITDPIHVCKEINWMRQYKEVNRQEQQRRSAYMQKYQRQKKTL